MLEEDRVIVREAAHYWWLFLISGILWIIVAWIVLRMNITSIAAVGVMMGVVFLLAGINEVAVSRMISGGWKALHIVMAVLFFLGALWGFFEPVNSFFALASVLGLVLFFYGAFEIVEGIASRGGGNPYWWANLVAGILLVLLGFWVSGEDRVFALQRRTYLILFWVGFFALFRGFSQIFLAFSVRHAGKEVEAATA